MANITKNNIFPTISKNHIKDTFNLYNQLVKNATKYQLSMIALATAVNELSASYKEFMEYAPMKAIIESSGQQNEINNSLKIYRILYESFKKMSEFLNRDFALPLNDDFKSMQVKFSDKKIEKTLKLEEKIRTRSMIPGITPEPSNIQRGLFQQYISAIKFVSRKTRKLQNYEIHVFQRMVQGILAYEDQSNSSFINQSISHDIEETPRLNYQSFNKKSILDVSQLDNGIFDESILKGINYDKNPLTNSFIRDEVIKSELNGDGKYFPYSNHSPDTSKDDFILGKDVYGNEMNADVNTNQSMSSDYSKRDYHHQRYTSTPNIYEMKYFANKYEEKNPVRHSKNNESFSYRSRSKSLSTSQNIHDNYKNSHYSMSAVNNKNSHYSTYDNSINISSITAPTPKLDENSRFSMANHHSSAGSGKSNHSNNINNNNNNELVESKVDTEEDNNENEEANTTITEHNVKRDTLSKLVKKTSFKKNFNEMKQKLHKRRSISNSTNAKPVSILKKRSATFSTGSGSSASSTSSKPKDSTIKNEKEEEDSNDEFIVISKKKMDNLIRTGKVHSIEDIFKKNNNESDSENMATPTLASTTVTASAVDPVTAPVSSSTSALNNEKEDSYEYPLDSLINSPEEMSDESKSTINQSNVPSGLIEETPDLANEATPRLSENVAKPLSRHTRNSSYGGVSQSHIRGMQSNIAQKNHSIIPNGYATPMLGHQEQAFAPSRLNKMHFPIEYATPMLSRFNNNTNYSPMLQSDVPSVNINDDIVPPRTQKAKSTISLQNLLNNWPNVEALSKPKEETTPVFSERKNSLPNFSERKNSTPKFTARKSSLGNPPFILTKTNFMIPKPEEEIFKAKEEEEKQNKEVKVEKEEVKEEEHKNIESEEDNNEDNNQKKKGVNWDDKNKEYVIPNSAISAKSNDESYYDDIINVTYATENEESSMMINDPTRLIFSKFNTSVSNVSGITENDSSIQNTKDSLAVPSKKEKRLSGLRNIITQDVLNDELPPTPVSPKMKKKTYEPSKPTRGESLHFKVRPTIIIEQPSPSPTSSFPIKEKTQEEKEDEIINNLRVAENEDGLYTPIVRIDNDEDELLTPIEKLHNGDDDEGLLTPIERINDNGLALPDEKMETSEVDSEEDSEDEIKLVDIPRFNQKILNLKTQNQLLNKEQKEEEEEEKGKGKEKEKEEVKESKIDYITTPGNGQPNDPFNYSEEDTSKVNQDDTENPELSDVEDEIIDINELEVPKKMDRKGSMKSVISNISSKFSQKFNSMFSSVSSSETTAVNNTENDTSSVHSKKDNTNTSEVKEQKEEKEEKEEKEQNKQNEQNIQNEQNEQNESNIINNQNDYEESMMTETTMDESAFKENIEEQREELAKSKDVFSLARKLSSGFIKGSGELIRNSSKESLKSLTRKFSLRSDDPNNDNNDNNNNENNNEIEKESETEINTEKPEEMEAMKKSNSIKFPRRHSSASLRNYTPSQNNDGEESVDNDDRSIKTSNTITSASLPRKDSLIRAASVKKKASVRSVKTVATTSSNLTSTPIMNSAVDSEDESIFDETPKIDDFPERPKRNIPVRPSTPNAPSTPVFPNIKLCNILMNHEEPSALNLNDKEEVIVISNPLLEVANNKNLVDYKNDIPNDRREFRISRNEAYMTFNLCQNTPEIESVMGSIVDSDEDSLRMDMLNNESSLSFRSINPSSVYEENNSVILTAPKLNNKKPELKIDTIANTSKVVAIIPSPIPQKDNNFAQRFNNLNAASLVHETREQQTNNRTNNHINNNNSNSLKKYVALYPYNARDGRELSFQRADIINVKREQGEWVYGYREELQSEEDEIKYGWVPKSYLKIITIF